MSYLLPDAGPSRSCRESSRRARPRGGRAPTRARARAPESKSSAVAKPLQRGASAPESVPGEATGFQSREGYPARGRLPTEIRRFRRQISRHGILERQLHYSEILLTAGSALPERGCPSEAHPL